MKLTGPASRLFETQRRCSRPGNLSWWFGAGGLRDGTSRRVVRGSHGRRRRLVPPAATRRLGRGIPPAAQLRPVGSVRQRGAEPCARRGRGCWARFVGVAWGGADRVRVVADRQGGGVLPGTRQ